MVPISYISCDGLLVLWSQLTWISDGWGVRRFGTVEACLTSWLLAHIPRLWG